MPTFRTLVVLLILATLARADDLRTLSGTTVSGTLSGISDSEITLKTAGGPVATPLAQALLLELRPTRPLPSDASYFDVRLLDDTSLRCEKVRYAGADVELTLLSGTTLRLPLGYVVSVLKNAQDAGLRKQFDALAKTKSRRDRILILRNGELNALEGTLGKVDAKGETIEFRRETGDVIPAKIAALSGFLFHRTEVPTESAICKVIDQDGNAVAAAKLAYDGKELTVTTTFGGKLALRQDTLARLDFNLGKLTFLSDLEPSKVGEPVFLGGFAAFRRDTNLDGGPIRLQDKQFTKGLSMYGGAEVEYNLAGKYKTFKATLGADARMAEEGAGKATVTVFCDGEKRLSEEVSAKEVKPIAVNVKDVSTLRIVVTGPNFTGYTAHATLADARVSQ
jgi:hypothetical protein